MVQKKKKKPAANPLRAVATTSIASKPKAVEKKPDSTDASETGSIVGSAPTAPTSVESEEKAPSREDTAQESKESHQLSPEELEAQLERDELQLLVEKYAQKVGRDSSRQTSRLQTDRRILRAQAQYLPTREWIPEELMQQILDLVQDEMNDELSSPEQKSTLRSVPEEDAVNRLWALGRTLTDIGFSKDRVHQVLNLICSNPPQSDPGGQMWGLQESLDWLAVNCPSEELPPYEGQPNQPQLDTRDSSRSSNPRPDATKMAKPELPADPVPEDESLDQDVGDISDLGSDLEPDELLSTYMDAKTRLFQISPDLVTADKKNSRSKKSKKPTVSHKPSPAANKLLNKLQQIESDVLFDQREADEQWASKRTELARESAGQSRRPKKADDANEATGDASGAPSAVDDIMAQAALAGDTLAEDGDDDALLGGMFSAEPGQSVPTPDSDGNTGDSASVTIRDFGKATGMNPRRILEEACRARDPSVRLVYKHVSPTTYSSRHALTITWSKDQEPIDSSSIPHIRCEERSRSTTFTMIDVATPGTQQSEAYVSVVALFLIFSTSPKEEKVYLRLPPSWRDLWSEFAEAKKNITDTADRERVKELRKMVQEQIEREEEEGVVLTNGFRKRGKTNADDSKNAELAIRSNGPNEAVSEQIRQMWERKRSSPTYQRMLPGRMQLPMFQFRDAAISAIERNQVVILCGETGCGKSTQLPAYILEHELSNGRQCKIYCTEPRRISAISLAQRVSEELGEHKNDVGTSRSVVGYAIRLESHVAATTRLVFATVGIVLRMLESAQGLEDITHLVIDEVHERSIDTDFLLIVLRSLMVRRPGLKVVLMSATVDAKRFSQYLDGAPILTVPGRTFPVQTKFLEDAIEVTHYTADSNKSNNEPAQEDEEDTSERATSGIPKDLKGYSAATRKVLREYDEYRIDYELILRLIERVASDPTYTNYSKAILVFLPGIAEIRQLNDMLVSHRAFGTDWLIYPLHSTIASEDQQAAFLVPPPGVRKIVLATNIAETGITIPDVTCVIDTGKHKEMRFDERRQLSRLIQSFISRANAKQRRGRAGRVQEGLCFHLFTKYRHDELMAEQQTPEMLRLSLQDLVMRVKICKLGDIEQTLSEALDPPSTKNIRRAIDALVEVDALTPKEELTALGHQLAKLPLDANLGKLALLASIFSCVDVAITIAAILSSKDPFTTPIGARQRADTVRLGFRRGDSDLLTAYNAYATWRKICNTPGQSEFQWCAKNFLSRQNLANIEDLKSQLLGSLVEAGFVTLTPEERTQLSKYRYSSRQRSFVAVPASANQHTDNDLLINAVIAWSFYPKILTRDGKGWRNIANNQSVSLHPTSVNKLPPTTTAKAQYLSYYHIMQSSNKFYNAHSTSLVHEVPLLLMAGEADTRLFAGVVTVDGNRLRFGVRDWKMTVAIKMLRVRVKEIVGVMLKQPGKPLSRRQQKWMDLFLKTFERSERGGGPVGKA
ncbi:P-loop containing nucleoside triphosphate hydrolase protein [Saccharata proteae CBS 121410]|uniref:RNA helicase n=1 Tax=Saccharata proteae CBS 121410 TaxID=1314787 RepID=A0A9P4LXV2_9PEZI|nr:P-loop containing nucleoside triphosphate hydrolase protein [Saccharata proteae CBS 121410]